MHRKRYAYLQIKQKPNYYKRKHWPSRSHRRYVTFTKHKKEAKQNNM